ncbi:hypothetical protein BJX70DRAFT_44722 [Aspergillus crustosus]
MNIPTSHSCSSLFSICYLSISHTSTKPPAYPGILPSLQSRKAISAFKMVESCPEDVLISMETDVVRMVASTMIRTYSKHYSSLSPLPQMLSSVSTGQ